MLLLIYTSILIIELYHKRGWVKLKEETLQLDLRGKKTVSIFHKSLTGGHQKSIVFIICEIKKNRDFHFLTDFFGRDFRNPYQNEMARCEKK